MIINSGSAAECRIHDEEQVQVQVHYNISIGYDYFFCLVSLTYAQGDNRLQIK